MKLYSYFKFFRHKILSLILFSIFSVILDFVKGIESFTFTDILIDAIDIMMDSVDYTYKKYLMEVKFMCPYKVASILYFTYLINASIYEIVGKKYGNFIYINVNIQVPLNRIKNTISIGRKILKSLPLIISYMLFYAFFYTMMGETSVIHSEIINIILPLIITLINSYGYKGFYYFLKLLLCNIFLNKFIDLY